MILTVLCGSDGFLKKCIKNITKTVITQKDVLPRTLRTVVSIDMMMNTMLPYREVCFVDITDYVFFG